MRVRARRAFAYVKGLLTGPDGFFTFTRYY